MPGAAGGPGGEGRQGVVLYYSSHIALYYSLYFVSYHSCSIVSRLCYTMLRLQPPSGAEDLGGWGGGGEK